MEHVVCGGGILWMFWLCLINVVLFDGVVPLSLNAPWLSSGGGETPWCYMSFLQVENTVHVMFDILLDCVGVCSHACSFFSHHCLWRHVLKLKRSVFSDLLRLFCWSVFTRTGPSTWTELSANEKRRSRQRASLWRASIRPGQTSRFSLPRAAAGRYTSTKISVHLFSWILSSSSKQLTSEMIQCHAHAVPLQRNARKILHNGSSTSDV